MRAAFGILLGDAHLSLVRGKAEVFHEAVPFFESQAEIAGAFHQHAYDLPYQLKVPHSQHPEKISANRVPWKKVRKTADRISL